MHDKPSHCIFEFYFILKLSHAKPFYFLLKWNSSIAFSQQGDEFYCLIFQDPNHIFQMNLNNNFDKISQGISVFILLILIMKQNLIKKLNSRLNALFSNKISVYNCQLPCGLLFSSKQLLNPLHKAIGMFYHNKCKLKICYWTRYY